MNINTAPLALGSRVGVFDHHKRGVITLAQVNGELLLFRFCKSVYKHEGSVDTIIVNVGYYG